MRILAFALTLLLLAACGDKAPNSSTTPETPAAKTEGDGTAVSDSVETQKPAAPAMGDPTFSARSGWVEEKSTSNMRKAQYRLAKAGADTEDAEVVIFWFGGDGGGVEANLERWEGQFSSADNAPVKGELSDFMVKGRRVDLIELEGTWAGSMGNGAGPNKAMVGAVIENEKGLYFARLVGGKETVAKWKPSYIEFLKAVY